MGENILDFLLSIQQVLLFAGIGVLGAIAVFAFGWWLHRLGVFRIARSLFCSVKGAAFGIVLAVVVAKGGAKLNLGHGSLLQVVGETNVVEYAVTPAQVEAGLGTTGTTSHTTRSPTIRSTRNASVKSGTATGTVAGTTVIASWRCRVGLRMVMDA